MISCVFVISGTNFVSLLSTNQKLEIMFYLESKKITFYDEIALYNFVTATATPLDETILLTEKFNNDTQTYEETTILLILTPSKK